MGKVFEDYFSELQTDMVEICMEYVEDRAEKGKDFRRALFAKEKEIFSLFGQDFQKRKDEEIEEILKKNPYNDI